MIGLRLQSTLVYGPENWAAIKPLRCTAPSSLNICETYIHQSSNMYLTRRTTSRASYMRLGGTDAQREIRLLQLARLADERYI